MKFLKALKQNRNIVFVVILITFIFIAFGSFVAHFNYKKSAKLHQQIKDRGISITAYSYTENCQTKFPERFYKFTVDNKKYSIQAKPEDSNIAICYSPLGDSITVYYLEENPNRNLTKNQVTSGVESLSYYIFIIIFSTIFFLAYTVGILADSYFSMKKITPLGKNKIISKDI